MTHSQSICLSFEESESAEGTVISLNLDVNTVRNDSAFLFKLMIVSLGILGKAEFSADDNSLSTWELEHGSLECFLGVGEIGLGSSD